MKNKETKNEKEVKQDEVNTESEQAEANDSDICFDRDKMTDSEYISLLEERLGFTIVELDSCKGLMQRLQADFDNYRRRNAAIAEDMKQLGQTIVIEKLLTVLDNCELARKFVQDEAALTGFNMMETQILSVLESFGLQTVEADGKDFDANEMSAVERVKNKEMQGKVVETLSKGYTLNGKLLRPASVKVGYWE